MELKITKSDFVRVLACPRYAWLWKHRRDLRSEHQNSRVSDQGHDVELLSHRLFEAGVDVTERGEVAALKTDALIAAKTPVIYQATFITEFYLAKVDILVRDPQAEGWHLYEVKSATKKRKDHIADLAFQVNTLNVAGVPLKSVNLIVVNNKYEYNEAVGLEPGLLFSVLDVTAEIESVIPHFKPLFLKAHADLTQVNEPTVLVLKKNFGYPLPKLFEDYYRAGVPDYSIYDVSKIQEPGLQDLAAQNIRLMTDIPEGFFKSGAMNGQVTLTKGKTKMVDRDAIDRDLASLSYPIYFLDYESINPAIPIFDGMRPHQHIPFQYSLHTLDKPDGDLSHTDFLHTDPSDPIAHLLKNLSSDIGARGSVIVWNQSFEKQCNKMMANCCPEYAPFLVDLNSRIYDLMLIFKDRYQDYRFKGSVSIKNVLPVLCPALNYKNLEIQHGAMAMDGIMDLLNGTAKDKEALILGLRQYCEMDTLAMVRIFEKLSASNPLPLKI
ncbi:MAG: hypothetical protein ACI9BD_000185 [Candidatus Marinamargulisbacteria bacterium]|jgi:hypothetical protein